MPFGTNIHRWWQDGREMYPDGSPICTQDFDNSTTNATVTCLDEETCRLYDAIPYAPPLMPSQWPAAISLANCALR